MYYTLRVFSHLLLFLLGNFITFNVSANPLEIVEKKIEVMGAITGDALSRDEVGIVILKDIDNEHTFAVPIGRTFVFQNQLFYLQGVDGRTVQISDGVSVVSLPYGDGRRVSPNRSVTNIEANGDALPAGDEETDEEFADDSDENSDDENFDIKDVKISSTNKDDNKVGMDTSGSSGRRIYKINNEDVSSYNYTGTDRAPTLEENVEYHDTEASEDTLREEEE